jgi:hypothetical protein
MNKIDIQINKAQLKSFNVEMNDNIPEIMASIDLYTANDKKITTFTITTQKYYSTPHFELPMELISPIVDIAKRLEKVVIAICKSEMALIPVKTEQNDEVR